MLSNYILKNQNEAERLDQQSEILEFSVERELRILDLAQTRSFLDAGCGSGILGRFIESHYPNIYVDGCDLSESSLAHCRKNSLRKDASYFAHNLLEAPTPKRYDVIVSRLVFHHLSLSEQRQMISHLKKSLAPEGKLCVIDTDGLFLNLGTTSESLIKKMDFLRSRFSGNLLSARYLPALFSEAGLSQVSWEMILMDFQGESRLKEVEQWRARFESSISFYIKALGSEFEARKFFRDYIEEASKDDVSLFYNKFVVVGKCLRVPDSETIKT